MGNGNGPLTRGLEGCFKVGRMEPVTIILLTMAGFAAGLLDSIAGGGGLISLPALLAAGLPPQTALGTNKFQSMFGTACALANYHRKGKVLWGVAAAGIPFSLAASIAGAKLALIISPDLLGRVLILLIPPAAVAVFFSRSLMRGERAPRRRGTGFWAATLFVCSSVGLYDGFFGPGTGTFLILALVLVARIPLVAATATAKTMNLASNAGAFAAFVLAGSVAYAIAVPMAAANIAGNYIGSRCAMKHGGVLIQRILTISLSLLFGYLVWKYYL